MRTNCMSFLFGVGATLVHPLSLATFYAWMIHSSDLNDLTNNKNVILKNNPDSLIKISKINNKIRSKHVDVFFFF